MTQENSTNNPTPDPAISPAASDAAPAPAATPTKPKRRWVRRIVLGLLILVVLLLLLLALTPTILSSGAGRAFVVGKINDNLNGHVEIANWSVGWTGGIRLDGVKVFDDANRQILELAHFNTELSLVGAIRGQFHLGHTVVDGLDFNAIRDADGTLNFAKLAKTSAPKVAPTASARAPPAQPSQPAPAPTPAAPNSNVSAPPRSDPLKLPDIDGQITINPNCRGTFQDDQKHQTVHITSIAGDVKIPSINDTIEDSLAISLGLDHGQPGSISLGGKIQVAKNNVLLDVGQMIGDQKLAVTGIDFGSLAPLAPPNVGITNMSGTSDATVTAHLAAGKGAAINAHYNIHQLTIEKGTGPTAEKVFDKYTMAGDVDANYSTDAGNTHITISHLLIGDDPNNPQTMIGIENADNKPIDIVAAADGKMQGSGSLHIIRLSLARLNEISKAFSPPPADATAAAEQPKLKTGWLTGTIGFGANPQQQLVVDGNLDINSLTITAPGAAGLTNEEIKISMAATVEKSFSAATVKNVSITGSMLNATVSDTLLQLTDGSGPNAKPTPVMNMLRKAAISVDMPSLAKIQTTLDAFSAPTPGAAPGKPVSGSASTSRDRLDILLALANPVGPAVAPSATPAAASAPAAPAPPTKLASGSAKFTLNISRDKDEHLVIAPALETKDLVLTKDSVLDQIGTVEIKGQVAIAMAAPSQAAAAPHATAATEPSALDQIASITFTGLSLSGASSSTVINGTLEDLGHARNFKNFAVDLTYNAGEIWKIILPLLSKDSQKSMKDAKVQGNYTRRFNVGGSLPAEKEFNEAIVNLSANGEFLLDLFDGKGATLKGLVIPFTLAKGKFRLAYADKPEGQNFAPAAELNGGKMVLAGLSVDLSDPHPTVSMPAGAKFLEKININPVFSDTFIGGAVNNPLFVSPDQATGQLSLTIVKCERLPIDDTVTKNVPTNQGVLDISMTINGIVLGNPMIKKISDELSAMKILGSKSLAVNSLQGDVKTFTVHMEHGVTDEDMTLTLGENDRPLHLYGNVAMETRMMNMTLEFPWSLFGLKGVKQVQSVMGDGVKLPLSGPVDAPKFSLKNAVQQNLKANPQDLIKGLLGKDDKSKDGNATTQPDKKGKIDDVIGNLLKPKDKKDK